MYHTYSALHPIHRIDHHTERTALHQINAQTYIVSRFTNSMPSIDDH